MGASPTDCAASYVRKVKQGRQSFSGESEPAASPGAVSPLVVPTHGLTSHGLATLSGVPQSILGNHGSAGIIISAH